MFRSPASARDTVDGDSPSLSANSLIVIRFMLAGVDSDKTTDLPCFCKRSLMADFRPAAEADAPVSPRPLRDQQHDHHAQMMSSVLPIAR